MATLTAQQIKEVSEAAQSELGVTWEEIPVSRQQFEALVSIVDEGLETAESNILSTISDPGKTWLINHQAIARRLIILVEEKRREVL